MHKFTQQTNAQRTKWVRFFQEKLTLHWLTHIGLNIAIPKTMRECNTCKNFKGL
jgi:hypothetical protein